MRYTKITLDRFDEVLGASERLKDKAAKALGFALQEEAQSNIQAVGAIDTGAMLNSVYTETSSSGSQREHAITRAKSIGGDDVPLGEASSAPRAGQAKVALAVAYAVYVEMGVENAFNRGIRIPGRPFLMPAAETIKRDASRIVGEIVKEELK